MVWAQREGSALLLSRLYLGRNAGADDDGRRKTRKKKFGCLDSRASSSPATQRACVRKEICICGSRIRTESKAKLRHHRLFCGGVFHQKPIAKDLVRWQIQSHLKYEHFRLKRSIRQERETRSKGRDARQEGVASEFHIDQHLVYHPLC